jgi:thiol-disulfide isomerase/thioredoxin
MPSTPIACRLALCASLAVAAPLLRAAPVEPRPAPAWTLKDVDGNVVQSGAFKGKVEVIDFWATWCGPCREEIPGFNDLAKKYGPDGLVIIGISVDQQDAVAALKKTIKKLAITYPIVLADGSVASDFDPNMDAVPTTFIVDRDGNIRERTVGAMKEADWEKHLLLYLNSPAKK